MDKSRFDIHGVTIQKQPEKVEKRGRFHTDGPSVAHAPPSKGNSSAIR